MVLVVLSVLYATGTAKVLNLVIEDAFTSFPDTKTQPITLVEADIDADNQFLIEQIFKANPQRVFWVLPDRELPVPQQHLLSQHDIFTVKMPSYVFDNQGALKAKNNSLWQPSAGYLLMPEDTFGISRNIPLLQVYDETFLAPVAALHPMERERETAEYYIDFSKISLASGILDRKLQQDLDLLSDSVAGTDVWLVPDVSLMAASVITPDVHGNLGWLLTQYHASALSSYEQRAYQIPLSFSQTLIVVLFLLACLMALVMHLPPKWKGSVGGLFNVVVFAIIIIASAQLGYVAPVLELVLSSCIFWGMTFWQFHYWRQNALEQINDILTRQVAALSGTEKDQGVFWDKVVNLIAQSLQLEKSIFLEIYEAQKRIREIAALHCSIEDIAEQRRDITREPYQQAVLAKQAKISNRQFFKNKQEDEVEILAPLFKGTEILGFWALSTKESEPRRLKQLQDYVDLFALQISTLLHLQKMTDQDTDRSTKFAERFGNQEQQILSLVKQKLDTLVSTDYVFNSLYKSMATPAVMFDVFGRVAMHNREMVKLAKLEKLQLENVNAYQFLKQLLPKEEQSLKNTIRQLSLENNMPAQRYFIDLNGREYIAVLSSVHKEREYVVGQEVAIGLNGLLCEFHSLQEVQHYVEVERSLYDNYVIHIKNHLSALQMGMMQIQQKAENALVKQLSLYLTDELNKASKMTRKTHYFMNRIQDKEKGHLVPFSPMQIIQSLLKDTESGQQELSIWRGVNFNMQMQLFTTLALGDPDVFRALVLSAFRLLADDAIAPKSVNIYGKQIQRNDVDVLYIKLDSEGYGLPNEQLQTMYEQNTLLGEHNHLSDLLQQLKRAESINMECRLKSKVGKGYRLSILLEGISLND